MNDPAKLPPAETEVTVSLYEKRRKIHARSVKGLFANWRIALVVLTQVVFYGGLWLEWNGRQALLLHLVERKFYLFGLILWPQDVIYLAVLLIISATSPRSMSSWTKPGPSPSAPGKPSGSSFHLLDGRLHARAGVQVHVPLRPFPERHVRPRHPDHHLRRGARRAARHPPQGRRPIPRHWGWASASAAPPASTAATKSWTRSATGAAWCAILILP